MKQKLPAFACILFAAFALWAGCKKPSTLGDTLLIDEYGEYVFTDTVEVRCTLEREDSSLTSDRSSTAEYFLCGELNDAEFGSSSSDIYALMLGETLNPNFDTTTQAFDSIVLYLRYAYAGFYGDTTTPQTLRILRTDVGQLISDTKDYYSDDAIPATEEVGRLENFLPKPNKRDSLFEGIKGTFLRVVLKPEFGQELFKLDSASYSVDSLFFAKLRGLKIVASSGAAPGAMMAFNLNDNSMSRMRLYYHEKADTTRKDFDFFFEGANKFTHFTHDHNFNNAPAGQLINKLAPEKMYIQGMQGLRVKVEFPNAQYLNNIAVNQAQLVLTVADEHAKLTPASQLFFTQIQGDTTFVLTSDVLYSFGSNLTGGFTNFGGSPKKVVDNGTTVTRYRLTISELFQHMVDDDSSTDTKKRTVYMGVYPRSRTANRVVLYGPKSMTFPAKLELTYTKVK
ncbi:MAG: hypothetical protein ACOYPR_21350 [Saprospiraceae bacterium]